MDHWAGPAAEEQQKQVLLKLEDDLLKNLSSGRDWGLFICDCLSHNLPEASIFWSKFEHLIWLILNLGDKLTGSPILNRALKVFFPSKP